MRSVYSIAYNDSGSVVQWHVSCSFLSSGYLFFSCEAPEPDRVVMSGTVVAVVENISLESVPW